METEQEVVALIHKQLTRQLSTSEEARLKEWLGEDDQRKQFYEEVSLSWQLAGAEGPAVEEGELDDEFERLQQKLKNADKQKDIRNYSMPSFYKSLAIVLLLISTGWGLYQWYVAPGTKAPVAIFFSVQSQGGMQKVLLPDSSLLFSRGAADFTFHQNEQQRKLAFSGLGFFEIARQENRPFFIQLKEATIKVLGTSFLVKAVEDESLEVGVESGKVEVLFKGQRFLLGSGEKWQLGTDKKARVLLIADPNYLSWKNRKLQFQDTPLAEVFPALERHYGIRVSVTNQEILGCRFTGTFEDVSLEKLLEIMSYSLRLSVEKSERGVFSIGGDGCN